LKAVSIPEEDYSMDSGRGEVVTPSLADVLDGLAEAIVTDKEQDEKASTEPLIDGVAASKAFRHREVMLLQAVAEKYGKALGEGVDASTLVQEFLGQRSDDKLKGAGGSVNMRGALDIDTDASTAEMNGEDMADVSGKKSKVNGDSLIDRSKYVPLRLTLNERKLLRLCEAALNVSEYTDKVDILTWKRKTGRIHEQIRDICAILSGLAVASDYEVGQRMIKDRTFEDNADYFAAVFEIGRRHKILNPERMRTDYGKLMHMLMDSQSTDIQALLEFRLVKKITTVHDYLEERDSLDLIKHAEAGIATTAISDKGKTRNEVQHEIKAKERAVKRLIKQFSNDQLSEEAIEWCLYSLADNSSFLLFNRDPVETMITYLKTHFPSTMSNDDPRSLAIRSGYKGARLTHSHSQQYQFAMQTLTLWREVQNDMFKLWCLAEEDLLDPGNYYCLRDTGQGLNRVQSAPRIGRAMCDILHRTQRQLGSWVGSSVVHLGDHNVPNALTFIDKYTQVPRFLNPIVSVIEALPAFSSDKNINEMIERGYGSIKKCQLDILQDFFKHAFDGSGADNFYDAGSCIDGRLTSAWNWCNKLDKKKYFSIFKLTGFTGFDGNFKG